jgi:hypothetical protein
VLARNPGLESAAVLYIHGAGDGPDRWAADLAASRGGLAVDWAAEARDRLAAPARGYAIGKVLAARLLPLDRVIYAHSAGAWFAQGLADGLAALPTPSNLADGAAARGGNLHLVFLDPFTAISLFNPFAGSRFLGKNASMAETFYTRADPIPFTSGEVAAGERTLVDDQPGADLSGNAAHWDIINWYFSGR